MSISRRASVQPIVLVTALVVATASGLWVYNIIEKQAGNQRDAEGQTQISNGEKDTDDEPELALSEEGRKLIWDVEDVAFQIGHKSFRLLAKAIEKADKDLALSYLADDFQGAVLSTDQAKPVVRGPAHMVVLGSDQNARTTDREAFVDWLLEQRAHFGDECHAKVKLIRLNPDDPKQLDKAWHGTWKLRIYGRGPNETAREMVAFGSFGFPKAVTDHDRPGAWINHWAFDRLNETWTTAPLLEEFSAQSGIDFSKLHDNWKVSRRFFESNPGGVFACDYNNDHHIDLLVTDPHRVALYRNRGDATFEDVTLEAGLPLEVSLRLTVAFADLDNDGDEDLVLADQILENVDSNFVQRGFLKLTTDASGFAVADYDKDGLVDLYVANSASGPHGGTSRTSWLDDESSPPDKLYKNVGDFEFRDVTDAANANAGKRSSSTGLWLDSNEDGWPDLYVINELGANVLLINQQNGRFKEQLICPETDGFTMGAIAGDLNGNGHTDLYLGNMFSKAGKRIVGNLPAGCYSDEILKRMDTWVRGNVLLTNLGDRFENSSPPAIAPVGWAYGASLPDLDADGRLDIHAVCGFASFDRSEPDG